jgi:hypothetical protein
MVSNVISSTMIVVINDGLQEVPKGDNWPRRHFFPGDLRDISVLVQYKKGL